MEIVCLMANVRKCNIACSVERRRASILDTAQIYGFSAYVRHCNIACSVLYVQLL